MRSILVCGLIFSSSLFLQTFATPVEAVSSISKILRRQNAAAEAVTAEAAADVLNKKQHPPPNDGSPGGIFNGIPSSPKLKFQDCLNVTYGDFYNNTYQCAR